MKRLIALFAGLLLSASLFSQSDCIIEVTVDGETIGVGLAEMKYFYKNTDGTATLVRFNKLQKIEIDETFDSLLNMAGTAAFVKFTDAATSKITAVSKKFIGEYRISSLGKVVLIGASASGTTSWVTEEDYVALRGDLLGCAAGGGVIQSLILGSSSLAAQTINISSGGLGVTFSIEDADSDPTNELDTFTFNTTPIFHGVDYVFNTDSLVTNIVLKGDTITNLAVWLDSATAILNGDIVGSFSCDSLINCTTDDLGDIVGAGFNNAILLHDGANYIPIGIRVAIEDTVIQILIDNIDTLINFDSIFTVIALTVLDSFIVNELDSIIQISVDSLLLLFITNDLDSIIQISIDSMLLTSTDTIIQQILDTMATGAFNDGDGIYDTITGSNTISMDVTVTADTFDFKIDHLSGKVVFEMGDSAWIHPSDGVAWVYTESGDTAGISIFDNGDHGEIDIGVHKSGGQIYDFSVTDTSVFLRWYNSGENIIGIFDDTTKGVFLQGITHDVNINASDTTWVKINGARMNQTIPVDSGLNVAGFYLWGVDSLGENPTWIHQDSAGSGLFDNLYLADGTLAGNRAVDMDGKIFSFRNQAATENLLVLNPITNFYAIGDIDGIRNSTRIQVDDAMSTIALDAVLIHLVGNPVDDNSNLKALARDPVTGLLEEVLLTGAASFKITDGVDTQTVVQNNVITFVDGPGIDFQVLATDTVTAVVIADTAFLDSLANLVNDTTGSIVTIDTVIVFIIDTTTGNLVPDTIFNNDTTFQNALYTGGNFIQVNGSSIDLGGHNTKEFTALIGSDTNKVFSFNHGKLLYNANSINIQGKDLTYIFDGTATPKYSFLGLGAGSFARVEVKGNDIPVNILAVNDTILIDGDDAIHFDALVYEFLTGPPSGTPVKFLATNSSNQLVETDGYNNIVGEQGIKVTLSVPDVTISLGNSGESSTANVTNNRFLNFGTDSENVNKALNFYGDFATYNGATVFPIVITGDDNNATSSSFGTGIRIEFEGTEVTNDHGEIYLRTGSPNQFYIQSNAEIWIKTDDTDDIHISSDLDVNINASGNVNITSPIIASGLNLDGGDDNIIILTLDGSNEIQETSKSAFLSGAGTDDQNLTATGVLDSVIFTMEDGSDIVLVTDNLITANDIALDTIRLGIDTAGATEGQIIKIVSGVISWAADAGAGGGITSFDLAINADAPFHSIDADDDDINFIQDAANNEGITIAGVSNGTDGEITFGLDINGITNSETTLDDTDIFALYDPGQTRNEKTTIADLKTAIQDGTGTDNQQVDSFLIRLDTLRLEIEDDGQAQHKIDMTPYLPLTQEEVEDFAGALITDGTGTHTRITITYQDGTGDVDFVVDDDLSNYSNATSLFFDVAGTGLTSTGSTVNAEGGRGIDVTADSITTDFTELLPETTLESGDFLIMHDAGTPNDGRIDYDNLIIQLNADLTFTTARLAGEAMTLSGDDLDWGGTITEATSISVLGTAGSEGEDVLFGDSSTLNIGIFELHADERVTIDGLYIDLVGGDVRLSTISADADNDHSSTVLTRDPTNGTIENVVIAGGSNITIQNATASISIHWSADISDLSDIDTETTGGVLKYFLMYDDNAADDHTWEDIASFGLSNFFNDVPFLEPLSVTAGVSSPFTVTNGESLTFSGEEAENIFIFDNPADEIVRINVINPGGDRLVGWDDDNIELAYVTVGSGLSFDGLTLTAVGGSGGMITGISKNSGANVNAADRSVLNFIEGNGMSYTIADDAGGDEVDVTIDLGGALTGETTLTGAGTAGLSLGTPGSKLDSLRIEVDNTLTFDVNSTGELEILGLPSITAQVDSSHSMLVLNAANELETESIQNLLLGEQITYNSGNSGTPNFQDHPSGSIHVDLDDITGDFTFTAPTSGTAVDRGVYLFYLIGDGTDDFIFNGVYDQAGTAATDVGTITPANNVEVLVVCYCVSSNVTQKYSCTVDDQ